MTPELAEAIVRAWLVDAPFEKISHMPGLPWHRYKSSVRTLVATHNVMANNALWDERPNTAYQLLLKHGLADKSKSKTGPDIPKIKAQEKANNIAFANSLTWRETSQQNVRAKRLRR